MVSAIEPIMTAITRIALAALLPAFTLAPAAADEIIQTERVKVRAETVARGLEHPWGFVFLPDGALLVTERSGQMRIVQNGQVSKPLAGVPGVKASGQGGLLDVALAPDHETSGTIFFTYSEAGGRTGTAVARARLVRTGQGGRLESVRTIFSMGKKTRSRKHFGSRLVVRPDGTMFFTIGDRGDRPRAQDLKDHAGAVLRINADGSIPSDNPYADGKNGLPELWSKGHRNPQGAVFDPVTQSLWITEHGARGGDELNQPRAGLNYGWPVISYGRHYSGFKIGEGTSAPGYEQPVHYWDPSIAPSGLTVYDGPMFPEWQGDFLAGALKFKLLSRLQRGKDGKIASEERMFTGEFGRIRDVDVAPDGSVYLLTDADNGRIIRLSRAN